MADPKNLKIKSKMSGKGPEIGGVMTMSPGPGRPRTIHPTASAGGPVRFPKLTDRTSSGGFVQHDIEYSDDDADDEDEGRIASLPSATGSPDGKQKPLPSEEEAKVQRRPEPLAAPAVDSLAVTPTPAASAETATTTVANEETAVADTSEIEAKPKTEDEPPKQVVEEAETTGATAEPASEPPQEAESPPPTRHESRAKYTPAQSELQGHTEDMMMVDKKEEEKPSTAETAASTATANGYDRGSGEEAEEQDDEESDSIVLRRLRSPSGGSRTTRRMANGRFGKRGSISGRGKW